MSARPGDPFDEPGGAPEPPPLATYLRSTATAYGCLLAGTALAPSLIESLIEQGYYRTEGFYHLALGEILRQILYAVLVIASTVTVIAIWHRRGPLGTPGGARFLELVVGTAIVLAGAVPVFLTSQPGELFGHTAPGWLAGVLAGRSGAHANLCWTMILLGAASASAVLGAQLDDPRLRRRTVQWLRWGVPAVPFTVFMATWVPAPSGPLSWTVTTVLGAGLLVLGASAVNAVVDVLLIPGLLIELWILDRLRGRPVEPYDHTERDQPIWALAAGATAIAVGIAILFIVAAAIARRSARGR